MWFERTHKPDPDPHPAWTWIDSFYLALLLVQILVVLIATTFGRTCP